MFLAHNRLRTFRLTFDFGAGEDGYSVDVSLGASLLNGMDEEAVKDFVTAHVRKTQPDIDEAEDWPWMIGVDEITGQTEARQQASSLVNRLLEAESLKDFLRHQAAGRTPASDEDQAAWLLCPKPGMEDLFPDAFTAVMIQADDLPKLVAAHPEIMPLGNETTMLEWPDKYLDAACAALAALDIGVLETDEFNVEEGERA